jgi:ABC-type dipeptide/oligopeptide/nickel transport system permease subunit
MNWKTIIRRMRKSAIFMIGLTGILMIVLICVFSPLYIAHNPLKADLALRLQPPEWFENGWQGHLFGTDPLGRDVLTRVLVGGQFSLFISFTVTMISSLIGIMLGLIAGFYAGKFDAVIMRLCDTMMSTPQLLLAICVVAMLGTSNFNLIFVLVITGWAHVSRLVRGTVLAIRKSEYIQASRVLGAGGFRIMFTEVLPNVLTPILIQVSMSLGVVILTEAGMSFLGMGVPLPKPSWGTMIADGRQYLAQAPWIVVAPGLALMFTVLFFNFLGDGLRDVFDPRNKD